MVIPLSNTIRVSRNYCYFDCKLRISLDPGVELIISSKQIILLQNVNAEVNVGVLS